VPVAARVVVPGIPADLAVAYATLNIRHRDLLRLDRVRRRKSCLGLGWARPRQRQAGGTPRPGAGWPDQVPRRWRDAKPRDVLRVEFTHIRGNARVFAVGIYRAAKRAK
jgi:hypothetical protein